MGYSPWGRKESGTTERLNADHLKQFWLTSSKICDGIIQIQQMGHHMFVSLEVCFWILSTVSQGFLGRSDFLSSCYRCVQESLSLISLTLKYHMKWTDFCIYPSQWVSGIFSWKNNFHVKH